MRLIAFLLLLATAAKWEKEPTAFAGVDFGANRAAVEARGTKCSKPVRVPRGTDPKTVPLVCSMEIAISDSTKVRASYYVYGDQMKAVNLSYPEGSFAFLRDFLIERYGEPTVREQIEIVSRQGTKRQTESLRWKGERVTISMQELIPAPPPYVYSEFIAGSVFIGWESDEDLAKKKEALEKF